MCSILLCAKDSEANYSVNLIILFSVDGPSKICRATITMPHENLLASICDFCETKLARAKEAICLCSYAVLLLASQPCFYAA